MSSRVEQESQARQAEAERIQKRADRESREVRAGALARDGFARLVRGSQQGEREAKTRGEGARADQRRGEEQAGTVARKAEEGDRAARMARGGLMQQSRVLEQARSFQGVMASQQAFTHEADVGRVTRREEGKQKDRVERDDREVAVVQAEHKRDAEAEQARIEARAEAAPNAAISGDRGRNSGGGQGRGDEGPAVLPRPQQLGSAGEAKAAREVKQIPPELLDKLVSAVWLGVNQRGIKEFQIELKDGPLQGAFVKVTAESGKIGLRFEGLGADERRLVEGSKGELMRRLEHKGLALGKLEVA